MKVYGRRAREVLCSWWSTRKKGSAGVCCVSIVIDVAKRRPEAPKPSTPPLPSPSFRPPPQHRACQQRSVRLVGECVVLRPELDQGATYDFTRNSESDSLTYVQHGYKYLQYIVTYLQNSINIFNALCFAACPNVAYAFAISANWNL